MWRSELWVKRKAVKILEGTAYSARRKLEYVILIGLSLCSAALDKDDMPEVCAAYSPKLQSSLPSTFLGLFPWVTPVTPTLFVHDCLTRGKGTQLKRGRIVDAVRVVMLVMQISRSTEDGGDT